MATIDPSPPKEDDSESDDENNNIETKEEGEVDEIVDNKEQFKSILVTKNKEIEKLKVLIETLEPIPGLDPNKYKKFVLSDIDDAFDFRDSKITSLAKKIRNLTMKLNKSNALNEKYRSEQELVNQRIEQLQSNYETLKKQDRSNLLANRSEIEVKLQKELTTSTKTIDELKRKQSQLQDEIKNLQRLLRSELGENMTIEQAANDPGWKGRARQIELLKIKLKKYEKLGLTDMNSMTGCSIAGVSTTGSIILNPNQTAVVGVSGVRTISTMSAAQLSTTSMVEGSSVDLKAMEDIAGISAEKRQMTENLQLEKNMLMEQNTLLETKLKGMKARLQTIEKEIMKYKQQIQLLLNKANTDDELIEVLREEIQKLKITASSSPTPMRNTTNFSTTSTHMNMISSAVDSTTGGSNNNNNNGEQLELSRLRRLCKQQADQLSTQEEVIRELRQQTINHNP